MSDKLKPVSAAARDLLGLLGVSAEEFQATPSKGKLKFQEATLTPTRQVVANWSAPAETWKPDARVLFLRHSTCKTCGSSFTAPHWPETFIRQRSAVPRSYKYTPSRSHIMSGLALPHIVEHLSVEVYACHLCPEWQVNQRAEEQSQCLEDLVASKLATSASSPSPSDQTSSTYSEPECGLQLPDLASLGSESVSLACTGIWSWSFTDPPSAGSQSYSTPGFDSSDCDLVPSAPAMPIASHIILGEATAHIRLESSTCKI